MCRASNIEVSDAFTSIDLNEPLLNQAIQEVEEECSIHKNRNLIESQSSSIPSVTSLKTLATVSGGVIAASSQFALWITLWDDNILNKSTIEVVQFSLAWSFWTCLVVFMSMSMLVAFIRQKYIDKGDKRVDELNSQDEDDIVFQIEAFYVVGALASISMVWIINDFFQTYILTATTAIQIHPVLTVLFAGFGYALVARWILSRRNTNRALAQATAAECDRSNYNCKLEKLSSTYQMIAATLGLIVGVCSQFLLAMILWRDNMTKPIVDSVLMFSLLWSAVTVFLTLSGCVSIRLLVVSNNGDSEGPSIAYKIVQNRVLLLMESAYVSSSLIGVCAAWIVIDVLSGMTSQILPSIFMLTVSLVAFRMILHFFPEEFSPEEMIDAPKTLEVV